MSVSPSFILNQRYDSKDKLVKPPVDTMGTFSCRIKDNEDLVNSGAPSPPRVEAVSKMLDLPFSSARFGKPSNNGNSYRGKPMKEPTTIKRNQFVLKRV